VHDAAWQREGLGDCHVDVAGPGAAVRCAGLVEEAPDCVGVGCSASDESCPEPLARVSAWSWRRGRDSRPRGRRRGWGGQPFGRLPQRRRWLGRSAGGRARGAAANHRDDRGTRVALHDWALRNDSSSALIPGCREHTPARVEVPAPEYFDGAKGLPGARGILGPSRSPTPTNRCSGKSGRPRHRRTRSACACASPPARARLASEPKGASVEERITAIIPARAADAGLQPRPDGPIGELPGQRADALRPPRPRWPARGPAQIVRAHRLDHAHRAGVARAAWTLR